MNLNIIEIHPADDKTALNSEWFVVENTGDAAFNTRSCTVSMSRGGSKKRRELGTMDPGFNLGPGEKVRVVTGNPGKKAHGKLPEDGMRNYSLFLGAPILQGKGTVLHLSLRSHPLAKSTFDPDAPRGVASAPAEG